MSGVISLKVKIFNDYPGHTESPKEMIVARANKQAQLERAMNEFMLRHHVYHVLKVSDGIAIFYT